MPTIVDELTPVIGGPDATLNPPNPIKWYLSVLLGLYLIAVSLTLFYMLYNLWPPQPRSRGISPAAEQTNTGRKTKLENAAPANTNINTNGNTTNTGNTKAGSAGSANVNALLANSNSNKSSAGKPVTVSGNANANDNSASTSSGGTEISVAENSNKNATQNDTRTAAEEILPTVSLFGGRLVLSHSVEVRLLWIAMLAGALGSFIHATTSFADYVGNRKLSGNWVWWYLLRPFIGMTLAVIFYFVVRGGFISPNAGGSDMNPFGIAAMAGLVGMFSKQAIDKLNEVFTALFGSKGDDNRGDKLVAATLTSVKPNSGVTVGGTPVTISGTGFLPGAKVTFGGVAGSGVVIDSNGKNIAVTTPPHVAGLVDIEVINANAQKGTLSGAFTYQDG